MKATRFDAIDKAELEDARLRLRHCPRCDQDLLPVAYLEDVYACKDCRGYTYHLPTS